MSMQGDSTLRVIMSEGRLYMGSWDGVTLSSPRGVIVTPQQNLIARLPGNPAKMAFDRIGALYEPTDSDFIRVYQEDVSGLSLPRKSNLVNIGGRA